MTSDRLFSSKVNFRSWKFKVVLKLSRLCLLANFPWEHDYKPKVGGVLPAFIKLSDDIVLNRNHSSFWKVFKKHLPAKVVPLR